MRFEVFRMDEQRDEPVTVDRTDKPEKALSILKSGPQEFAVFDKKRRILLAFDSGEIREFELPETRSRRPVKSGMPREKEKEKKQRFDNPVSEKIRGFRSWLRRMGNIPSVTKGSSRPVETVFRDIFGGR